MPLGAHAAHTSAGIPRIYTHRGLPPSPRRNTRARAPHAGHARTSVTPVSHRLHRRACRRSPPRSLTLRYATLTSGSAGSSCRSTGTPSLREQTQHSRHLQYSPVTPATPIVQLCRGEEVEETPLLPAGRGRQVGNLNMKVKVSTVGGQVRRTDRGGLECCGFITCQWSADSDGVTVSWCFAPPCKDQRAPSGL